MDLYYIKDKYQSEIEVTKSKFISYLFPINDINEVSEILLNIKTQHKKARHFVYSYIFDQNYYFTDNGEPSNTAGKPTFDILKNLNLNRVLLITVRYFGGIKLGASNLLRTYMQSAKKVCESAIFYKIDYLNYFELEINNQDFKILQKFIINNKGIIEKIIYNGNVVNLNLKIYKSLDELMYLSSLKIIKQEIVKNYVEVKNNG